MKKGNTDGNIIDLKERRCTETSESSSLRKFQSDVSTPRGSHLDESRKLGMLQKRRELAHLDMQFIKEKKKSEKQSLKNNSGNSSEKQSPENKFFDDVPINNPSKDSTKCVKNFIILNYCKYIRTNKEPTVVAEEIGLKIFSLFNNYCLNRYSEEFLTPVLLKNAAGSDLFKYIKESVCELHV